MRRKLEWETGVAIRVDDVPIAELEGEYLVVRPSAVLAIRVEPRFQGLDD